MTYGREIEGLRRDPGPSDGGARHDGDRASVDALEAAATLLGRRWKLGILCLLARGRYRYNAMMRELPGATPKMLTQQLRSLEEEGLITRHEVTGGGKHTEYELTPVGEHFLPVVEAFTDWVSRHWRRSQRTQLDREPTSRGGVAVGGYVSRRAD